MHGYYLLGYLDFRPLGSIIVLALAAGAAVTDYVLRSIKP